MTDPFKRVNGVSRRDVVVFRYGFWIGFASGILTLLLLKWLMGIGV